MIVTDYKKILAIYTPPTSERKARFDFLVNICGKYWTMRKANVQLMFPNKFRQLSNEVYVARVEDAKALKYLINKKVSTHKLLD